MRTDRKIEDLLEEIRARLPKGPKIRRNPYLAKTWFHLERITSGKIEGMSVRCYIEKIAVEAGLPDNVMSVAKPYYEVLKAFVFAENEQPKKDGIPEHVFDFLTREECRSLAAYASDASAAAAMHSYFAKSKFSPGWIDFAIAKAKAV